MQPEHIHNHLRLCLDPVILTSRQELGMQPKLLCPRRSRFAPGYKLRLQLKAEGSKLKVEVDGQWGM